MSLNKEQIELIREWWAAHFEFKEKIIWIGCNPSNPEMFKQQADDGFKLMFEFSKYTHEMMKKIDDAGEETPEDRFRAFLSPKVKTNDLVIFKPNGSKKIIEGDPVDKILDQAGLTNAEKLEFKFEKDFPGRKALFKGLITDTFKQWLIHRNLWEDYFKYGDYKDELSKH
jgi:hypothetical protein